jgi:chaperone modulatory protein CbpM
MSADGRPGDAHAGEVLGATTRYTLVEASHVSGVRSEVIITLVTVGVLAPSGPAPESWVFTEFELLQLKRAWRLHRDLEVALESMPLVLELLDEVERLRRVVARQGGVG